MSPLTRDNVVFSTDDYVVTVGEILHGDRKGADCYLLINTRTNVVEGELGTEFTAINVARECQRSLDEALEDEVVPSDPDEFDETANRLEKLFSKTE